MAKQKQLKQLAPSNSLNFVHAAQEYIIIVITRPSCRWQQSTKMQAFFFRLFFGVAILPHAQYSPYYVTVVVFGMVMADSSAGLFSLEFTYMSTIYCSVD